MDIRTNYKRGCARLLAAAWRRLPPEARLLRRSNKGGRCRQQPTFVSRHELLAVGNGVAINASLAVF